MSKTYHNDKTRRSWLEGREHEHNKDAICAHCGKPTRGGIKKRNQQALDEALSRVYKRPHDLLDLIVMEYGDG